MKNKYHNIIFPVWLFWISPIFFVVALIGNYVIDKLVLTLGMKHLKIDVKKELKDKRTIIYVYLFGFLSDFIGMFCMLFGVPLLTNINVDLANLISISVYWNPFNNIIGFLYVCICILITGFFIYLFNYKFSFKHLTIEPSQKRKLALIMAIFTAPYLFLFPTSLIYAI